MTGWPSMAGRAAAAGLEFLTCPQLPAWPCSVAFEDDWDRLERYLFGAACRAVLRNCGSAAAGGHAV